MIYKPGEHIYLAAGFFKPNQVNLCEYIEGLGKELGLAIYSPRLDGGVLKKNASSEEKEEIFQSNCTSIQVARWVLVVIDDYDPGVIWELGYAYGMGKLCIAYSDVSGRGLNVMLAESCRGGFINGRDILMDHLTWHSQNRSMDPTYGKPWEGSIN
ncbi:MAG: nucleoside 2-deoxyribosyltransferase [Nitrosopumilus sp.]